jgi:hypothetical protein
LKEQNFSNSHRLHIIDKSDDQNQEAT